MYLEIIIIVPNQSDPQQLAFWGGTIDFREGRGEVRDFAPPPLDGTLIDVITLKHAQI